MNSVVNRDKKSISVKQLHLNIKCGVQRSNRLVLTFLNQVFETKLDGSFDQDLWLLALKTSTRDENPVLLGYVVELSFFNDEEHLIDIVMNLFPVFLTARGIRGCLEIDTERSKSIKKFLQSLKCENLSKLLDEHETIANFSAQSSMLYKSSTLTMVRQLAGSKVNARDFTERDISFLKVNDIEINELIDTLKFIGTQHELSVHWYIHRSFAMTVAITDMLRAFEGLDTSNVRKLLSLFPNDRQTCFGLLLLLELQATRSLNFRWFSLLPLNLLLNLRNMKRQLSSEVSHSKKLADNISRSLWFLSSTWILLCSLIGLLERFYDSAISVKNKITLRASAERHS